MKTADVCDALGDLARVLEPMLADFGGVRTFSGPITTVKVHEDNTLVRRALEEPGRGRILVVDGGGSRRCALLGDQLACLGRDNGWAGVIVWGCVRDVEALAATAIGIKALGATPRRSAKHGAGQRDVPVTFGGVTFVPGEWICADTDGVLTLAGPPQG